MALGAVPGLPGEFRAITGSPIVIVADAPAGTALVARLSLLSVPTQQVPIGGGVVLPGWIFNAQRGRHKFLVTVSNKTDFFELVVDGNGLLVRIPMGTVDPADVTVLPNFSIIITGLP